MRKTVSVYEASKILGGAISPQALYRRLLSKRPPFAIHSRYPLRLRVDLVLAYKSVMVPVAKKGSKPTAISKLLTSIESRYDRAAHSSVTVGAEATPRTSLLGRRFGSSRKRVPTCR